MDPVKDGIWKSAVNEWMQTGEVFMECQRTEKAVTGWEPLDEYDSSTFLKGLG